MQNGDEASPSITLAGRALLMKMLITLELHGIFCSYVVYFCILTLSNRWYAKQRASIWPVKLLVKTLKTLGPHGIF